MPFVSLQILQNGNSFLIVKVRHDGACLRHRVATTDNACIP